MVGTVDSFSYVSARTFFDKKRRRETAKSTSSTHTEEREGEELTYTQGRDDGAASIIRGDWTGEERRGRDCEQQVKGEADVSEE